MSIAVLDVEDPEELALLFAGQEKEIPISIGQTNVRSADNQSLSINFIITTRVDLESGDTLVRFIQNMGTGLIPFVAMKEGSRRDKEDYEERKKIMDEIIKKTSELKRNYTLKLEGKGHSVIKGVWTY